MKKKIKNQSSRKKQKSLITLKCIIKNNFHLLCAKDIIKEIKHAPSLKKGNKFFISKGINDAMFNRAGLSKTLSPDGYFYSAVILLEEMEYNITNNYMKDSLLYPMLFSIHQYLELIMKYTISIYTHDSYIREHDLFKLWITFKEKCIKDKKDSEKGLVENLIKEFNLLGNNSFPLRYPYVETEHVENSEIENICFDVLILKKRILQIYIFFTRINDLALAANDL